MKRLFRKSDRKSPAASEATMLSAGWRRALASLRGKLATADVPWLLLSWDVGGMEAVIMQSGAGEAAPLAGAASRHGRFGAALDEVMEQLSAAGIPRPKRVALAARHVLPTVADLPVHPDKPRRPEQMRELIQADLEPVMAEFGSLWSMGALLQARGYLSPADRERITLEEAIRRQNRGTQLRYGEIAMELDLIDREALDECLDQQAALQNLDASVMAGWRGRIEDKHPLWLVCGVGQGTYREWREALSRHGLRLDAALPLAWLASDPQAAVEKTAETRHEQPVPAIDIEFHAEEVVAVHRRHGRVVATRSEGRIERAPAADWLSRIIADWAAEPRAQIAIHFLAADDDEFGEALADTLNLTTGHPCATQRAAEARQALWRNLLREASAPVSRLPRLAERELFGSPWKHPDVRRLLAIGGVLLGLVAFEAWQQYQLHRLEQVRLDRQHQEKEQNQTTQMTVQVNLKLAELGKELESTRRQLEPLLADRSRLSRIAAMRADLPDLLYLLTQAIGNDAVLEEVHTDNTGSSGSAIQVVAWSPNYTGAQDFVSRMAVLARERGYGVSQTEILERKGRDQRRGHEVKFWLLLEEGDLEAGPINPAESVQPAPTGGGISSQAPTGRQAP
jgi:hypothetical protein